MRASDAVARRHGLRPAALLRPLPGCHRAGRRRAHRPARGRAPDLGLLAPQPHRRGLAGRRARPRRRSGRDRSGLHRVRRKRPVGAGAGARRRGGRAHAVEGVRAGRRPRRLPAGAAGDRAQARGDPASREHLQLLRRPGRAGADRGSRPDGGRRGRDGGRAGADAARAVAAWAGRSPRRPRTACSPTWESRSSRGSRAC